MSTTPKLFRINGNQIFEQQPDVVANDGAEPPYPRDPRGRITVDPENVILTEAMNGTVTFPDLLRAGMQFDADAAYQETAHIYPSIAQVVTSTPDTPREQDGKIIRNTKRGMIITITAEMQKFDQVGKVRELGDLMGRAARLGEEQDVMNVLSDPSNYTHDNVRSLPFTPENVTIAYKHLSGMGANPNTLVITPRLWQVAQEHIHSGFLKQAVDMVGVSPQFNTGWQWALMERGYGLVFQRVEPVQVLFEGANTNPKGYFERDLLRYRVRNWYGCGILDDQNIFYSNAVSL